MTSMARTGMFSQGKAQPVQQSFGTPYGEATMGNPPGTKSFGASPPSPASGSSQKQSQPFSAWAPQQQPAGLPARQPSSQTFTGDPRGLWALTPENRPPPAQVGPAQTPWGPSMDPGKDQLALIAAMNEQRMQRQLAFNSAGTTPRPQGGFPKLDFNKAMQDAGLGQGSPSMSPEYGDSMIKRLNEQFSKPFQGAPAMPQMGFDPGVLPIYPVTLPQQTPSPQTQTMLPTAPQPAQPQAQAPGPQQGYVDRFGPAPPGVDNSRPWMNDPSTPLPQGWRWVKYGEGSRSAGWVAQRAEVAANDGFKYPKDPTLNNPEFTAWLDKRLPARFMRYDRATNERLYDQFMSEKSLPSGWENAPALPYPPPPQPPPLAADRTKEDTRRRVQNPERFRRFDPVTNKEVQAAQPVTRYPTAPWWSNGSVYAAGIF